MVEWVGAEAVDMMAGEDDGSNKTTNIKGYIK